MMGVEISVVVQIVGVGIIILNGVVLFYMKGTRDQLVKMNGSIQNTRETYMPRKEMDGWKKDITDSLDRVHARIDQVYMLLVDILKGKA